MPSGREHRKGRRQVGGKGRRTTCSKAGCGGCGTCSRTQVCNSNNQCQCQPQCDGKQCYETGDSGDDRVIGSEAALAVAQHAVVDLFERYVRGVGGVSQLLAQLGALGRSIWTGSILNELADVLQQARRGQRGRHEQLIPQVPVHRSPSAQERGEGVDRVVGERDGRSETLRALIERLQETYGRTLGVQLDSGVAAPEQRLQSMQVCASLDRAASECNDACFANSSARRS